MKSYWNLTLSEYFSPILSLLRSDISLIQLKRTFCVFLFACVSMLHLWKCLEKMFFSFSFLTYWNIMLLYIYLYDLTISLNKCNYNIFIFVYFHADPKHCNTIESCDLFWKNWYWRREINLLILILVTKSKIGVILGGEIISFHRKINTSYITANVFIPARYRHRVAACKLS